METARHSISIHYVQAVVAAAKRQGFDHQKLLIFAGISERILENPGLRITADQLSRLLQELWRVCDDEFMCMGSRPSRHGVFTLMAKQAVRCRNLREVFHHISHFYNLVAEAISLEFRESGDEIKFVVKITKSDNDPDGALREFLLLLWHRFPSWLIGQRIPLNNVTLDFAKPAHSAEHRLMYPCVVQYDQPENSLIFDRALLNEAVVQTPATLSDHLRRAPLDWFKHQAYYPMFTRRVIDYLESETEPSKTKIEHVAKKFHITSRTLRRKLNLEGTCFQTLKDDYRRDTAIHYLSQPNISISEISRKLGFSEPTAFTRAFKQWTGEAPGIYRRS